ncbi:MAG TPA: aminodeoxychorismate/anthranilate synthase component II [Candidatus Anaerobutyricum faecale]|uniref:anthranilate synthase component II n=1 Tax=Eubacterium sp. An11 TaxID=1965542 RepID=UPI000B368390|nr:aminodeoxychorismate/anthranilate synthase component II [Eubacterium sp. An11]OUQ66039.1 aminodeoxychorismate/anthranilate synthase component II [Eubacterium sp. An11]HJC30914.1 aminodeoxychorismate/anthranilate synthase component II [Candidatus Anaerobutyricum faecale]
MILLIDNYDSFTYNLYQYMGIFHRDIQVVRNDKITVEEIQKLQPERIVLSPGPKSPADAGICMDVVQEFYDKVPILGICLGHQSIGAAFGAEIIHAKELMHGKQSRITHSGRGIFQGIPSPVRVARYHSLAVDEKTLSPDFEILARTDDGEIMAMEHKKYPVIGIQFHPESVFTEHGKKMIENFLNYEKKES